ncbi:MAG: hypothetical protein J3K34DRAFT_421939 [Monoraphidium minutum]|nr:MAG: hypothetical protein J3K34DRAFT_421939 [Monoraphidium minutum]
MPYLRPPFYSALLLGFVAASAGAPSSGRGGVEGCTGRGPAPRPGAPACVSAADTRRFLPCLLASAVDRGLLLRRAPRRRGQTPPRAGSGGRTCICVPFSMTHPGEEAHAARAAAWRVGDGPRGTCGAHNVARRAGAPRRSVLSVGRGRRGSAGGRAL